MQTIKPAMVPTDVLVDLCGQKSLRQKHVDKSFSKVMTTFTAKGKKPFAKKYRPAVPKAKKAVRDYPPTLWPSQASNEFGPDTKSKVTMGRREVQQRELGKFINQRTIGFNIIIRERVNKLNPLTLIYSNIDLDMKAYPTRQI